MHIKFSPGMSNWNSHQSQWKLALLPILNLTLTLEADKATVSCTNMWLTQIKPAEVSFNSIKGEELVLIMLCIYKAPFIKKSQTLE